MSTSPIKPRSSKSKKVKFSKTFINAWNAAVEAQIHEDQFKYLWK